MVEGVVAIPFFILMLAGTTFVGGFYGQRIGAQSEARAGTWLRAVNENCDQGANIIIPGMTIVDSADLGELSSSPLVALCDKDFGAVTYTPRRTYDVTGVVDFNGKIQATAMSLCNESPVSGDVAYEAAVEYLWKAWQSNSNLPNNTPFPSIFDWGDIFGGGLFF